MWVGKSIQAPNASLLIFFFSTENHLISITLRWSDVVAKSSIPFLLSPVRLTANSFAISCDVSIPFKQNRWNKRFNKIIPLWETSLVLPQTPPCGFLEQ